ncbi:cubico group peptidase, beta-lactamase class c family [Plakobranchus ocellatus]|uniref:Cubico group peptidase, beta-lactamase class c family n=1 Tax=Plakobranchus ocellatus TaxID=259542 RepID=A0AAV3Y200_9GAST|nr:cubico group peptidase, beta-lactamase class c family [Plakobranchus ocellatus]
MPNWSKCFVYGGVWRTVAVDGSRSTGTSINRYKLVRKSDTRAGDIDSAGLETGAVFGKDGLLSYIKPWREETVDERLWLITVDQLLRHSCGWDVDHGPLYDPLLNKLYLERGHEIPDIARQIGEAHPLRPVTLISYVMSQPLAFAPGTRTAYSNMAYLVLGRVVEVASQMEYSDFLKKYILEPCGMWNTRLEPVPGHTDQGGDGGDLEQPLYRAVDPVSADSTLGWFSTVYDLMRFARCTFETGRMLNDRHLELLLARRGSHSPDLEQRGESWYAAGFRTNSHGVVWQDGDTHADDLILYHDLRQPAELQRRRARSYQGRRPGSTRNWQRDEAAVAELEIKRAEGRERLPESWVVLLHGKSINHIRHYTRDLMAFLDTSEDSLPKENLFLYDLSDMHRHPSWEPDRAWSWGQAAAPSGDGILTTKRPAPAITVRYRIDEHHMSAYISALKQEGFDVHWFTSYPTEQHTSFLVMGRRVVRPERAQYDFVFKHGLDYRRLLKDKLWLERGGYNLTQLHSYTSRPHGAKIVKRSKWVQENNPSFAALFRYEAYPQGTQMKYGTGHLPEPYQKLVQMYHEKEFFPVSQTVTWSKGLKNEEFAFVFVKRSHAREGRTEFQQQYDLSPRDLAMATARSTKANLRMAYLNSYNGAGGRVRFSAVFTNSTKAKGLLEMDQPQGKASEITISNMMMGLAPKFMVPYRDGGDLRFAIYYEEF